MGNKKWSLVAGATLFFLSLSPGWCDDYAVYWQSFRGVKTIDNQLQPESITKTIVTLINFSLFPDSLIVCSYALEGKKFTPEGSDQKFSKGKVLTQGSTKTHFSYLDETEGGGQHFSWSTGKLKTFTLGGKAFDLPPCVITKGVGVPRETDNPVYFKEYRVVGVLWKEATAVVNTPPADSSDSKATTALVNYLTSQGYTFN